MRHKFKSIQSFILIVAMSAAVLAAPSAYPSEGSVKLLTAHFESRQVVQVEIGDFHFKPGQVAPIHTHAAPAIGYVARGEIIYQVEGEKQQILSDGDVFFEPVGPRILRFDNASATEEAVFLDFNLEQVDEPFIVFENPPTEAIDRRTLPTIDLEDMSVNQVDFYVSELSRGGTLAIDNEEPTLGLVAEGVVKLNVKGEPAQRLVAGGTFVLQNAKSIATLTNDSSEVPAKVITFRLK